MVQRRLTRLPDWKARLAAEMDRGRRLPFEWGTNDCVIGLARRTVIALTGEDLGLEVEGTYSTEIGAKRLLKKMGYTGLGDLLGHLLPSVHADSADVGDLAVVEAPGGFGHAVAVFDTYGLITLMPDGQARMPREAAILSFSVG